MSYEDGEIMLCHTVKYPKARKEHLCCECSYRIETGIRYEYFSGVWGDHEAGSFKTCRRCLGLRVIAQRNGLEPVFGELIYCMEEAGILFAALHLTEDETELLKLLPKELQ